MEAVILWQSAQWQTKVLPRPGAVVGYCGSQLGNGSNGRKTDKGKLDGATEACGSRFGIGRPAISRKSREREVWLWVAWL
jgi:hypothetical protein